jgi:hypothetical protein
MGAQFSRLRLFFSFVLQWVRCRAGPDFTTTTTRERLPDSDKRSLRDREGRANDATSKRRALLVGISYQRTGEWEVLEGTHMDVRRFRQLLISAYSRLNLAGVTSLGIDSFSQKRTDTQKKISLSLRMTPTFPTSLNQPGITWSVSPTRPCARDQL